MGPSTLVPFFFGKYGIKILLIQVPIQGFPKNIKELKVFTKFLN
jgi:hypothetical protein